MRGEDTDDLIYFSFIDADTVSFNQVYSSYLEIVRKQSNTHSGIPPTVMSKDYEFPEGDFKRPSHVDNGIQNETAKYFSLGTYYPEPNFCFTSRWGGEGGCRSGPYIPLCSTPGELSAGHPVREAEPCLQTRAELR